MVYLLSAYILGGAFARTDTIQDRAFAFLQTCLRTQLDGYLPQALTLGSAEVSDLGTFKQVHFGSLANATFTDGEITPTAVFISQDLFETGNEPGTLMSDADVQARAADFVERAGLKPAGCSATYTASTESGPTPRFANSTRMFEVAWSQGGVAVPGGGRIEAERKLGRVIGLSWGRVLPLSSGAAVTTTESEAQSAAVDYAITHWNWSTIQTYGTVVEGVKLEAGAPYQYINLSTAQTTATASGLSWPCHTLVIRKADDQNWAGSFVIDGRALAILLAGSEDESIKLFGAGAPRPKPPVFDWRILGDNVRIGHGSKAYGLKLEPREFQSGKEKSSWVTLRGPRVTARARFFRASSMLTVAYGGKTYAAKVTGPLRNALRGS